MISVIVPVYLVEMYLRECVESILRQTYSDIEVILVDDGSPDSCPQICDEYSRKDSRVKVIHKENGGLSSARNAGLFEATGDYFGFVDGDDWIASDMYEYLLTQMQKHEASISTCGRYHVYKRAISPRLKSVSSSILNYEQAISEYFAGGRVTLSVCDKLFKKEVFAGVSFPIGKISEDVFIAPTLLSRANVIAMSTDPKYYVRQRFGSITRSVFSVAKMDGIDAGSFLLNEVKTKFPNLIEPATANVIKLYLSVLLSIIRVDGYKELTQFVQIKTVLLMNFRLAMKNRYVSREVKVGLIALKLNIVFLKVIGYMFYRSRRQKCFR